MRCVIAAAALLFATAAAHADKRIFIIPNADGYGIDRCLATGESCGKAAANSYCRAREFVQAVSYRKVDRDDITGAIPTSAACRGADCDAFVAIECAR